MRTLTHTRVYATSSMIVTSVHLQISLYTRRLVSVSRSMVLVRSLRDLLYTTLPCVMPRT
ncbi:hypothetical protein VPHD148_0203 [Vibrio phage D148]